MKISIFEQQILRKANESELEFWQLVSELAHSYFPKKEMWEKVKLASDGINSLSEKGLIEIKLKKYQAKKNGFLELIFSKSITHSEVKKVMNQPQNWERYHLSGLDKKYIITSTGLSQKG